MEEAKKDRINKLLVRPSSISDEFFKNKDQAYEKGFDCGFHNGKDLIGYKRGYSTVLYSYAHQGKTQLELEQKMYLAKKYGAKHIVYLSENGRKHEILGDLIMIYLRKRLFGDDVVVDLDEIDRAIKFIDDHFLILYADDGTVYLSDCFNAVIWARQQGFDAYGLTIDHFYNVSKSKDSKTFNMADYVKEFQQSLNRNSLLANVHTTVLAHVRDPELRKCKVTNEYYAPEPTAFDITGGQMWFYLGFQLISVWQTPQNVINPLTNEMYESGETHIRIAKSKPKGIGRKGVFPVYFDRDTQTLRERINGEYYGAGDFEKRYNYDNAKQLAALKPNIKHWNEPQEAAPF